MFPIWNTIGAYFLNNSEKNPKKTEGKMAQQAMPKKRILLVDDEPQTRELLASMLGVYGYSVSCVSDGSGALSILRKEHDTYDAILMDVVMPELDGIETTRTIKGLMGVSTPVISISAERMRPGLLAQIGMSEWVSKPIAIETLLSAIERVTAAHVP